MPPTPLFIASLGNPGPSYANTLHSAGHVLLSSIGRTLSYPPFQKKPSLANGRASSPSPDSPDPWTLWQSPSLMNDSGPALRRAFLSWSRNRGSSSGGGGGAGRLVVLHDELERPLGAITVRTAQGLSAKGHNGLKSLLVHCSGVGVEFVRIGVGIGRPVSRSSDDVAKFVLRKMTASEVLAVEGAAGEVIERLRGLG